MCGDYERRPLGWSFVAGVSSLVDDVAIMPGLRRLGRREDVMKTSVGSLVAGSWCVSEMRSLCAVGRNGVAGKLWRSARIDSDRSAYYRLLDEMDVFDRCEFGDELDVELVAAIGSY